MGLLLMKFTWGDIEILLNQYQELGPLPGIFAAWIESLLPFLPLVAILIANVNAYGLGEGILLSWVGVVTGAISVFWLFRRFGNKFSNYIDRKWPRSRKLTHWLEQKGFLPIFLLACFPFTPSFFVNLIAGISKVPMRTFVIATVLGKGIMIMMVSYVGHDLGALLEKPWRMAVIVMLFILLAIIGRKLESKFLKG
jgi:uncharacterized membrane protein YdjX (TVP38/TMEM64 family)